MDAERCKRAPEADDSVPPSHSERWEIVPIWSATYIMLRELVTLTERLR